MSIVPSRWRGIAAGLAAALGIGGAAQAETPAPRPVPTAWVVYAEQATDSVAVWLSDEAEASVRLRRRLLGDNPEMARPVSLRLKVWIGVDGALTRVEAMDPLDPGMASDLEAALAGRRLDAPPADMAQPLRLAIDLEPQPVEPEPGGDTLASAQ